MPDTLEHAMCRGIPNLSLRASVIYGTLCHSKQARLASSAAAPSSTDCRSIKVSRRRACGKAAFIAYLYLIWLRKTRNYFLTLQSKPRYSTRITGMLALSILCPRKIFAMYSSGKNANFKGLYLNFYRMNSHFFCFKWQIDPSPLNLWIHINAIAICLCEEKAKLK